MRRKEETEGKRILIRLWKIRRHPIFLTRFPDSWDTRTLWNMFDRYGRVFDVFLANRRTKMGTRFGFVRFVNIPNPDDFEKKLREICIGNTKLVKNMAKYGKENQRQNFRRRNIHQKKLIIMVSIMVVPIRMQCWARYRKKPMLNRKKLLTFL